MTGNAVQVMRIATGEESETVIDDGKNKAAQELGRKHKSSYTSCADKLSIKARSQILSLLYEGMSMRAVARIADVSFNTVAKALIDAGTACAKMVPPPSPAHQLVRQFVYG
ncbi:MAG: hypothetical protein ACOY15_07670 [Pseudomonadota bacterium]